MFLKTETQRTFTKSYLDDYICQWIEAFLIDQHARDSQEQLVSTN